MHFYFNRYSVSNREGNWKKNIRSVLSKIKNLSSPIERDHWLKELSGRSGITEGNLAEEMEGVKASAAKNYSQDEKSGDIVAPDNEPEENYSRKDIIGQRIATLVTNHPNLYKEFNTKFTDLSENYRSIIEHQVNNKSACLPADLQSLADLVVLRSSMDPNLEPESSDTFTIGFVYNPISIPTLTIAVDYYDLEVTDTIGFVDPGIVCLDPLNTAGLFCDKIKRDGTGNVSRIESNIQNRGVLATDGIDVQLRYQLDLPPSLSLFEDYARLSINTALTHVLSLKSQENIVTQVNECSGTFGWPCDEIFGGGSHPDNRMTTNVNYASGPFNAHLTWRWIDGMDTASGLGLPIFYGQGFVSSQSITEIPSWNYFDLGLSYQWGESTRVRFGINNVFDKESPFMADWVFTPNTDTLMYDVFGRTYYLNLSYQITGK